MLNADAVAGEVLVLDFLEVVLAGLELDSQCSCSEWGHNHKLGMTTVLHFEQHLHTLHCFGLVGLAGFPLPLRVPLQATHGTA